MTSSFVIICCLSSLVRCLFKSLALFKIGLSSNFWLLEVLCHAIDISPLHIDNIVYSIIMKHFSSHVLKLDPETWERRHFIFPSFLYSKYKHYTLYGYFWQQLYFANSPFIFVAIALFICYKFSYNFCTFATLAVNSDFN